VKRIKYNPEKKIFYLDRIYINEKFIALFNGSDNLENFCMDLVDNGYKNFFVIND